METEATILDSVLLLFLPAVGSVVIVLVASVGRRFVLELVRTIIGR
jgi:hypothetical protein